MNSAVNEKSEGQRIHQAGDTDLTYLFGCMSEVCVSITSALFHCFDQQGLYIWGLQSVKGLSLNLITTERLGSATSK